MNWGGKECLTADSIENIKKAFRKVCKEYDLPMSEVYHRGEDRRFNVFDFVNEFGESISYEQAEDFIWEWIA